MKTNRWGEPIIPCKHCGADTPMTGTRMCHRCWELDSRISADPELAAKILKEIQK